MVIDKGIRFTIRDGNCTLGSGVVTNVLPNLTEKEREDLHKSKKKREKEKEKEKAALEAAAAAAAETQAADAAKGGAKS